MSRALTSASNIARRQACPGSALAESQFPDTGEDSEYSAEGTLLHNVCAGIVSDEGLSGEQKDVITYARRAMDDVFRSVHLSMAIAEDEPFETGHEEELWVYRGLKKVFPGHCDVWRFYPRLSLLIIIDHKFGRVEVTHAEANLQLRSYAVAGARKWKAQNVVVAINQPRLPAEKRLTMAEYTEAELPAAQAQLIYIWDGSHNPDGSPKKDMPRVAGEEQCRYCSARLQCDAYRDKFEFLAKPSANGKDVFVKQLAELTDADLDKVHIATRFAALIADSVKSEILRRMENGGMQNYEQKPTGNTSTITDPVRAVELLEGIGLTKTEIMKRAKFSLDALSEDWREKNGGTHVAAKRAVRDALEPVLEVTAKSPSLKRLHDPIVGIDDQPKLL